MRTHGRHSAKPVVALCLLFIASLLGACREEDRAPRLEIAGAALGVAQPDTADALASRPAILTDAPTAYLAPTFAPPTPPAPPAPRVHTVAPGERLPAIAAAEGQTVAAIVRANGLRGSRLAAGQTLTIPAGDERLAAPAAIVAQAGGPAIIIDRGFANRRSVALTFDAGADRGYAESILNTLRDSGVRASFGMTGVWAAQNPDLLRRMVDEGHRLINHTWDHASWTGLSSRTRPLSQAQRWAELDSTEAYLREQTGVSTLPYFRSPYGDVDSTVQRDLGARGYAYNILWSVDSGGWTGAPARSIIDRCLRGASPGAIYVMHVGAASQDALALAPIINGLAAAGYDFETIDEILQP